MAERKSFSDIELQALEAYERNRFMGDAANGNAAEAVKLAKQSPARYRTFSEYLPQLRVSA